MNFAFEAHLLWLAYTQEDEDQWKHLAQKQ